MWLMSLYGTGEMNSRCIFFQWIRSIGDGTLSGSNDGRDIIDIPENILVKSFGDPVATVFEDSYPMFRDAPADPSYLKDRDILAPTLDIVETTNGYMSSSNSYDVQTYLSSYNSCKSDANVDFLHDFHTPYFLMI